jgi:hypothetical protein
MISNSNFYIPQRERERWGNFVLVLILNLTAAIKDSKKGERGVGEVVY